ncbi:MAG: potassium channel protein [Candidatus Aminicenantales bacterium]
MWKPVALLLCVILIGTIGYILLENWSFLDSLYMTIITIFTVGFKEVKELTPQGQIFTIFVILGGVGTAIFAFTKFGEIVYEGGVHRFWRRRIMERRLENLENHYIICGHGRMGRIVRERLEEEHLPFVVIDNNEKKFEDLKKNNKCCFIEGDATHEDVLLRAGVKKAKGLVALLPTDPNNLYLVMTVRLLNPSIFVLSKALEEEGEKKILQIGANKVVTPYTLSGLRIAQALIRPTVVDFVDLIIRRKELSLYMEEFVVKKNTRIENKTLKGCNLRQEANVIVVAIKKPGEDIVFNPSPDIQIEMGDTLLVLGDKEDIARFEKKYL